MAVMAKAIITNANLCRDTTYDDWESCAIEIFVDEAGDLQMLWPARVNQDDLQPAISIGLSELTQALAILGLELLQPTPKEEPSDV